MQLPANDNPVVRALYDKRVWVCWRAVERDGKIAKIPVDPRTGKAASVTQASTWGTYRDAANRVLHMEDVDGVGIVFCPQNPLSGIDLDKCLGAQGAPVNGINSILERFDTYFEVSPSGSGLHALGQGKLKGSDGLRFNVDGHAIEAYSSKRFFTLTGERFNDRPIRNIQPGLDWCAEKAGRGSQRQRDGADRRDEPRESPKEDGHSGPKKEVFEDWLETAEKGIALFDKADACDAVFAVSAARTTLAIAAGFDWREEGWSPSQFDLAMSNELRLAGMPYEEIVCCLMLLREMNGHDVKARADYYARTIVATERHPQIKNRQQETKDQPHGKNEPESESRIAQEQIYELTGHWIEKIEKYMMEAGPLYKMFLGEKTQHFKPNIFLPKAQRAFIELIQSMTNRACRALSNKDYELVRDSLLKLIIDVSLGDESTDRGEGLSIFRRIMERAPEPAPDLVVEKIDNGSPLEWHDEVWIKRDVIADFVAKQMGRRVPDSTLNRLMIAAGSREHLIAARKEQSGKQTTRKLWLVPQEAMEDE